MTDRRAFLGLAGAGLALAACKKDDDEDVGAVEDLMREHGVIRRGLVVFREAAARIRAGTRVDVAQLVDTAKLIRSFGEDYHEKQLEEAHIFPAIRKTNGADVDTLVAQHQRGREITDFVMAQKATSDALAKAMEAFSRMYEFHAAFEDTVIFPAWKKAVGKHELHEMGETFEDIEKKTFGKDGFDDGVRKIAAIEKALSLDLASLTAPKG